MARSGDFLMFKSRIKDVLEHYLYAKPREVYAQQLAELVIASAVRRQDGVRGFQFKGRKFCIPGERINATIYPRLPRELDPAATDFLAVWDPIFQTERPMVLSYISHVLNKSDDPLDYLPQFPSGMREYIQNLYVHYQIPIDGLKFSEVTPAPGYKEAYEMLCGRVTLNLLME